MASSVRDGKPKRRTQAERRAATRQALLDAAIECLVAEGYARTTTRRIAQRAGVTPGALQHHFPSKASLLAETRRHISERWVAQLLASAPVDPPSIRARNEALLNASWEIYKGPLFQAGLELLVAARTDPELRATGVEALQYVAELVQGSASALYPELAGHPQLGEVLATGLATLRGLALLTFSHDADPEEKWPATRSHLLAMSDAVLADDER